jgi:ribosomal protein S18 acetylase RimI-like enzyme
MIRAVHPPSLVSRLSVNRDNDVGIYGDLDPQDVRVRVSAGHPGPGPEALSLPTCGLSDRMHVVWSPDGPQGMTCYMPEAGVRIEPLAKADVASAVELAVRVLRVKAGDRGEQFAADIAGNRRQTFVAKTNGQVVAYGRVLELAADEAGPQAPAGYYLSGLLVEPAWRCRGIGLALTQARLDWVLARTDEVFCVIGADNIASLHLHAALGFQEIQRFASGRSAAGVDVLSRLVRTANLDASSLNDNE